MKKTDKNYWILPALLTTLLASSCETLYAPPKAELCVVTAEGDGACNDKRLPEDKQSYFRALKKGDIATNPDDYKNQFNYCSDIREKLIKCERKNLELESLYFLD